MRAWITPSTGSSRLSIALPTGSMILLCPKKPRPRSTPTRLADTRCSRLSKALARVTRSQSAAVSIGHSSDSVISQFVQTTSSCAPFSAYVLATSGKAVSQQIMTPNLPKSASNMGYSLPALHHFFSVSKGCTLRYVPCSAPSLPITAAALYKTPGSSGSRSENP